jgi:hypothetical protein
MSIRQLKGAMAGTELAAILVEIAADPGRIALLRNGLEAPEARYKYQCAKVLRALSESHPAGLAGDWEFFLKLLDHPNNILQWEGLMILGNLARVLDPGQIESLLPRYLRPITGPVMITAANCIRGAAKIAQAKPFLAARIAHAILRVEKARYKTPECRHIGIGHAIRALDAIMDLVPDPHPLLAFVERQLRNPRPGTRKAAAQFWKRHNQLSATDGSQKTPA